MDIFRENFHETFDSLKSKIETCKFWSFDLEMSGINTSDKSQQNRRDDSVDVRYKKMVSVATKFSIIQFGLCLFHDDGQGGLLASPYNFYLFPNDSPQDIVLSASAIKFLRDHNMDFQKWIGKGVTFVDALGEQIVKDRLFGESKPRYPVTLSAKSDIEFMERNMQAMSDFMDNDAEEIFTFEGCNGFLRRCIYEQVEAKYPNQVIVKKADWNSLSAFKVSQTALEEKDRQDKEKKEKDYFDALGFRHVFNALVESRKPLVGHNLFADLLFTLRWFDAPLPDTYQAFRQHLHQLFPCIYDTKYIDGCGAIGVVQTDTSLQQCFQRYCESLHPAEDKSADATRVPVAVGEDLQQYVDLSGGNFHAAGYDAYCTGYVFAQQMALCEATGTALESCANKIFMMWSVFDMDLDPIRNVNGFTCKYPGTMVRLTGFPKKFDTQKVLDLCSAAGFSTEEDKEKLKVIWVDDYSLFVSLPCEWNDIRISQILTQLNEEAFGMGGVQLLNEFLVKGPAGPPVSQEREVAHGGDEAGPGKREGPVSMWRSAVNMLLGPFRWAAFGDTDDVVR